MKNSLRIHKNEIAVYNIMEYLRNNKICYNIGNITSLDFYRCAHLKKISKSVAILVNLEVLKIMDCERLYVLPDIRMLTKLDTLVLKNIPIHNLPVNLHESAHMQHIVLDTLPNLSFLPHKIGHIKTLQLLSMYNLGILRIPKTLCRLENLKFLLIRYNRFVEVLHKDMFVRCCKLKTLDLEGGVFRNLPDSISHCTSLTSLSLSLCKNLKSLPNGIGNLVNLTEFNIMDCTGLVELPDSIQNFHNLNSLDIIGCNSLKKLPESIANMHSLEYINVIRCRSLHSLELNINSDFLHLKEVSLIKLHALECIPEWVTSLQETCVLEIDNSIATRIITQHTNKTALLNLKVSACTHASVHTMIRQTFNLTTLCISNINLVVIPTCVTLLSRVKTLSLIHLQSLESICNEVGNIQSLEHLFVVNCCKIQALCPLPYIKTVTIEKCKAFCLFGDLGVVQEITVRNCSNLSPFPASFKNVKQLHTLYIPSYFKHRIGFFRAFSRILPHLSSLQTIGFHTNHHDANPLFKNRYTTLYIGLCLKITPVPNLKLMLLPVPFSFWSKELGTPDKLVCVIEHFRLQHHKMLAFAMGMNPKLGMHSQVRKIDSFVMYLIGDYVLGLTELKNNYYSVDTAFRMYYNSYFYKYYSLLGDERTAYADFDALDNSNADSDAELFDLSDDDAV